MTNKVTGFLVKGFFLLNLLVLASLTTTLEKMDKKESIGPVPQFLSWGQEGQNDAGEKVEANVDTTAVSSEEQKKVEEEQNKEVGWQALGGSSENPGDSDAKKSSPTAPTIKPIISITPADTPTPSPILTPQPTNQCIASGGTFSNFPNSCGDSCILVQYPGEINCLDVMTDSCDCGPSKCWNGTTCVDNPNGTGEPNPIDPPVPVCGNGVCEPGEEGVSECPVCLEGEVCPLRPCFLQLGACPEDCSSN